MGTKRIRNSNFGTPGTQCGKFQRFNEIYEDFRRDPDDEVAYLIRNIDGSRRQLDFVIRSPFGSTTESAAQYVDRIRKFIDQAKSQKMIFQRDVAYIPQTQEYAQLKEELHYFIPFMFDYYVRLLEDLIPIGINTNNFSNNSSNRTNTTNNSGSRSSNTIPNWKGGKKTRRTRRSRRHR